jgi:adenine-specific DNA-methyltransferase
VNALTHLPHLSFGDSRTENAIIHGDNLAVLDALAPETNEAVRCIYIDPPYNNSERYTHYDDREHHERWLDAVEARLAALRPLLRADGSLWISIDDTEVHYLKVLADRIFGRDAFVTTIVWEHRTTRENRRVFSNNHEYVLVYARDPERFKATRNPATPTREILMRYKNPDDDPRGPWQSVSLNAQAGHGTPAQFYEVVAPNGRRHRPPKGRCWIYTEERMRSAIADGDVWFGRDGNGVPRLKRFLATAQHGMTPSTLWPASFAGTTTLAKRQMLQLFPDEPVFDTPKPEQLLARILEIATDPGDLVLDAYLGSGTTAAVAHKMRRRWIGIENGQHAVTHCAERLRQVVSGESGGISPDVQWKGGGGFHFHRCDTAVTRAA